MPLTEVALVMHHKYSKLGIPFDILMIYRSQKHPELLLKVSKSQNKFMKSSFLPINERNIARISALTEILAIFHSFFGRNGDFINLF